MGMAWDDDAAWRLTATEADLPAFLPYYTGNGRLGVRVGPLVLDWDGDARPLLTEHGPDRWGQLNARLLLSLAKHAYDGGDQLILPAWNQARLEIGGVAYGEGSGRHRLRNTLDLRDGAVSFEDDWEYRSGRTATIKLRLVVPRSFPCVAWYELTLSGLQDPARLRFGLNAGQVAGSFSAIDYARKGDALIGRATTRHQGRTLVQGLRWKGEEWLEAGCERGTEHAWVTVETRSHAASLVVAQAVHCSVDGPEPARRVADDLDALFRPSGLIQVADASRERWRSLWSTGLHFQHPEQRWERLVLASQFHLLASLEEDGLYPLGALGLSRPGWHGSQLWDADFWVFRGILPLWPELARSIVRFRRATLSAAQANAAAYGLHGAFYPWLSTDEGKDITTAHYRQEIHNNIWIALAARAAAGNPPERAFLTETAWPILEGVAEFLVSRATRDADGSWHLRGVVPPDESVCEAPRGNGTCDDSVLTNTGARVALQQAMEAARILGRLIPPAWIDAATNLLILQPGPDGVIPEYAGYSGHQTKQADTILAFYPLGLEVTPRVLQQTMRYYHDRVGRGGPLMTCQIEALLTMLHGDREDGLEYLFTEFMRYVRGPFLIPYETPENANSVMLTGIGGLLQTLIYGWYGAGPQRTAAIPRIGDGWAGRAGAA